MQTQFDPIDRSVEHETPQAWGKPKIWLISDGKNNTQAAKVAIDPDEGPTDTLGFPGGPLS